MNHHRYNTALIRAMRGHHPSAEISEMLITSSVDLDARLERLVGEVRKMSEIYASDARSLEENGSSAGDLYAGHAVDASKSLAEFRAMARALRTNVRAILGPEAVRSFDLVASGREEG